ncbi:MAG TPA: hypothetical protein GXZ29_05540, partial [Clostridiales bacterium]|nr:hypothetical protein [Clostridiales bacterium]
FTPSLTTVALDHHELGRQSILLYSYLYKQSSLMSASVKLDCKIIVRETTLETQILQGFPYYLSPNIPSIDFYEDSEVNKIMQIEDFITRCDDLDFLILRGLFNEIPYSKLSETIYITENAIRYRVKRMLSWLSLETEECLLSTIEEYISPSAIDNAISIKSKQNHR